MLGLHQTSEGLETDLHQKMAILAVTWELVSEVSCFYYVAHQKVIWITIDEHNIFKCLELQYKLLNVIFKLKYGIIVLKFAFVLRLTKSF